VHLRQVVDMFVALGSGARLLLVSQDIKLAPHTLVPLLARERVTVLQATPSFLQMYVPSSGAERERVLALIPLSRCLT
jgi:non-ribosomal peptide synthetase component F